MVPFWNSDEILKKSISNIPDAHTRESYTSILKEILEGRALRPAPAEVIEQNMIPHSQLHDSDFSTPVKILSRELHAETNKLVLLLSQPVLVQANLHLTRLVGVPHVELRVTIGNYRMVLGGVQKVVHGSEQQGANGDS